MKQNTKIAVIGGTGKSGKYLVKSLLKQGHNFKALIRNPENFKTESPLIEVIHGDVCDYSMVLSLISGCDTIISTLGAGIPPSEPTVFTTGTKNVLRAMTELRVKRYIVVTGLNVDTPFDKKGPKTKFATAWMHENYPKSTMDRQEEYHLLTDSDVDWTLVRLPMIRLTDKPGEAKADLEDCLGDGIGAADLANFLINQMDDTTFVRKAPFIATLGKG